MSKKMPTIICLIVRDGPLYLGEGEWVRRLSEACLFTPTEAWTKVRELAHTHGDASIAYAIQDGSFNFYDGAKFVYDLQDAKIYGEKEAHAQLKALLE